MIDDKARYTLFDATSKASTALPAHTPAGIKQEAIMDVSPMPPAHPRQSSQPDQPIPQGQPQHTNAAPGFYPIMQGETAIIALCDGTLPFPLDALYRNTTPEHVRDRFRHHGQELPAPGSFNAFLVARPDRLILIDTGSGDLGGPALGQLAGNLQAAGYQPAQVDDIILTHLHNDHFGGLIRTGDMTFPNARVHMPKRDADFFLSPAAMAKAPAPTQPHFKNAIGCITPYANAGRVSIYDDNEAPIPGIAQSILLPGHSPGHSGIIVQTGVGLQDSATALLCWGDISHGHILQFEDPDIAICFDVDITAAITSRKQALELAAREQFLVAGCHIAFPGLGHVSRHQNETAYRWHPVTS
ncbi:MBL fold metallo-hydrolase [Thalassospira marina]|uniref:MBL fold metallo-hydrolase n=2 Tax=Thalassospira marina TaxID=2048283 RepID=A0ABN5FLN1_9PROT|nr:MBL fold metallo-hydrolase [Thalassospira marina]